MKILSLTEKAVQADLSDQSESEPGYCGENQFSFEIQHWIQEQIFSKFRGSNRRQRLSPSTAETAISPLPGLNSRFFTFHTS